MRCTVNHRFFLSPEAQQIQSKFDRLFALEKCRRSFQFKLSSAFVNLPKEEKFLRGIYADLLTFDNIVKNISNQSELNLLSAFSWKVID